MLFGDFAPLANQKHLGTPDMIRSEPRDKSHLDPFRDAFVTLDRRISLLLCLPLTSLDKLAIKKELDKIGHQEIDAALAFGFRIACGPHVALHCPLRLNWTIIRCAFAHGSGNHVAP